MRVSVQRVEASGMCVASGLGGKPSRPSDTEGQEGREGRIVGGKTVGEG